jgi:hypothetical protein
MQNLLFWQSDKVVGGLMLDFKDGMHNVITPESFQAKF